MWAVKPKLAILISCAALLCVVGYLAYVGTAVTPEFEEVFRGLPGGIDGLPLPTRALLVASKWCAHWWWTCAIPVAALLCAVARTRRTPKRAPGR